MVRLAYFLLFSIMLFSSSWVYAVPVDTFTFQGLLKNNDGVLITGKKDITLRLYTVASGGTASSSPGAGCPKAAAPACVWQENQTNIDLTNGIFTIFAGNTTSLNRVDFTKALYLEVIIRSGLLNDATRGTDQVLSPRINITASPFALSTERGHFGYFNGTQFLINQTDTTSTKTVMNITNFGLGSALVIKSGATFNSVINITAGSLTSGAALNITSGSGSDIYRNLVLINQNSTGADSAIALKINQAGTAAALNIKSSTTGADAVNITAGRLTLGSALSVASNSGDDSNRDLVAIDQNSTNADSATALFINQGGPDTAVIIQSSTTGTANSGAVNITAGRLTLGSALSVASNSGSVANRNLVEINQNSTAATGAIALKINQGGTAAALNIQSSTTGTVNSGAVNITAGRLTLGSALSVASGSGSPAYRQLVNISNTNVAATGTTVLNINQSSTGPAVVIDSATTGLSNRGVLNITAGSLTFGPALLVASTSGSDINRNLVEINQNSTGADSAIALRINQAGTAAAVIIKSSTTGAANSGAVNITAGSLTAAKSSALVVGSSSGAVAGVGKANERNLVNITQTNKAATNTVLLNVFSTAPSSTLIRAHNATSIILNVTTSGLVQVSNLQVNASAGTTRIFGIYSGTDSIVTAGGNMVTVTGAGSGDVAACSLHGVTRAGNNQGVFVIVSNVTTNTVFVNVTANTLGILTGGQIVCLVFDLTGR